MHRSLVPLFALGLLGSCSMESSGEAQRVLRGSFSVSYGLMKTDSSWTNITGQAVVRIEFHENYLVLGFQSGGGAVLPTAKLQNFRWSKSNA